MRRCRSSIAAGMAPWLIATRAQAVSIRLTPPCRAAGGPGCSAPTAAPPRRPPRRGCGPCGGFSSVSTQAAHHGDGHRFRRLLDLDHLEAAGQRGVLLEIFLVFGPGRRGDGAQLAARQRRLQQVGRIALPGRAAGADQRVRLVDEQDDRLGADAFTSSMTDFKPVLELALHAGARLQQPEIERAHGDIAQRRRHVARRRCAPRSLRPPRSCRPRPRR